MIASKTLAVFGYIAVIALLASPCRGRAQEEPQPAGPALGSAPERGAGAPEVEAIPPSEADEAPGASDDPHAAHGHGGGAISEAMERAFREPVVARAEPNPALPAGQIRVFVVDEHLHAQIDHEIQLGVMQQGGERERFPGRTNQEGVFVYEGLPTGSGQAYRVNVPSEGATFSSTPFQLPTEHGYDVHVQTTPVTHDDRNVLLVLGQTMFEIKPDQRLHVVQQARLANLSADTYVFPEGGRVLELPRGFMAFQAQPMMTDQRVSEVPGRGIKIEGSLPNGQVTLAWGFDLPITGSEMTIDLPNPFRTFQYRVISLAPDGMSMDVEGMPPPASFQDQGRPLLGTEVRRTPSDPPFSRVRARLRGIPGPSPARLYALALALAFGLGGALLLARRPERDDGHLARARRRKELLEEAAAVERDFEAGEIGPKTRQSRREAIVRALAVLFYEEERVSGPKPAPRATNTTTKAAKGEASADPVKAAPPRAKAKAPRTKSAHNDEPDAPRESVTESERSGDGA